MITKNLGELVEEARKKHGLKKPIKRGRKRKKMPPTGLYNVKRTYCDNCSQGFIWAYTYKDTKGKNKIISRVDLLELRKEVRRKKLRWNIEDYDRIKETVELADITLNQII